MNHKKELLRSLWVSPINSKLCQVCECGAESSPHGAQKHTRPAFPIFTGVFGLRLRAWILLPNMVACLFPSLVYTSCVGLAWCVRTHRLCVPDAAFTTNAEHDRDAVNPQDKKNMLRGSLHHCPTLCLVLRSSIHSSIHHSFIYLRSLYLHESTGMSLGRQFNNRT